MKLNQVAWLSDYTLEDRPGGCQETNQVMINAGKELGLNIETVRPKDCENWELDKFKEYKLIIINNLTLFPAKTLNYIIDNCKYIRYEHDYASLDRLKEIPKLFDNSVANIFLSPLHRNQFIKRVRLEYKKIHLQPSPVLGFKSLDIEREKDLIVYAGLLSYGKGLRNVVDFMNRNKDLRLEVYSWNHADYIHEFNTTNIKFIGAKKNEELIEVYNKANYFIHMPDWQEPFGRAVMEAYYSGCNLLLNNKLGCRSYDWDWTNHDEMIERNNNHANDFWDFISKFL